MEHQLNSRDSLRSSRPRLPRGNFYPSLSKRYSARLFVYHHQAPIVLGQRLNFLGYHYCGIFRATSGCILLEALEIVMLRLTHPALPGFSCINTRFSMFPSFYPRCQNQNQGVIITSSFLITRSYIFVIIPLSTKSRDICLGHTVQYGRIQETYQHLPTEELG